MVSIQAQEKINILIEKGNKKHNKIVKKYPQFCAQYLYELHDLCDWFEKEKNKVIEKDIELQEQEDKEDELYAERADRDKWDFYNSTRGVN